MKSREISGQITLAEYLASLELEKENKARRPVRKPARAARQPTVPPRVRKLIQEGAGRPGARIRIERALKENGPYSYEPVRVAEDELAGAGTDEVKIYRRGIRDMQEGWCSWSLVLDFISGEIDAGTWLSQDERRHEEAADLARKETRKKGWKL